MCGIAAYIGYQPDGLEGLSGALAHRGPDASGTWRREGGGGLAVHLVHTRLSILDLSPRGHQPMVLEADDGRLKRVWSSGERPPRFPKDFAGYALSYNGEIYNYGAVRSELEAKGHVFESSGDTEVLLRGLAEWGEEVLPRLDGIFALAFYDGPRRRLLVARDPLGIKPLYYARTRDGGLLFASEVRAIADSGRWIGGVDRRAIADMLRFGSVQEPGTICEGIWAVSAGTCLSVDLEAGSPPLPRPEAYWKIEDFAGAGRARFDPAEHAAVLDRTVGEQLASDVPVGLFLSGGLDSSVLLERVASIGAGRVTAFTVGGELATNDEAATAVETARRAGVRHLLVRPTASERETWIRGALDAMDQPSCDGVNTYVVSRASRAAGLIVALGGAGADELHGAYGHADSLAAWSRRLRMPVLGRLAVEGAVLMARLRGDPVKADRIRLMATEAASPWRLLLEKRRFLTPGQAELLWPAGRQVLAPTTAPASEEALEAMSAEFQVTVAEVRGYLLNTLLRDGDWASMANGQELRVPYLGRAYVEYMLRLPRAAVRSAPGMPKPLLAGLVSPENRSLLRLPKRGFSMNYALLLRGSFREEFHDACRHLNAAFGFAIDPFEHLRLLGTDRGGRYANRLWAVFALGRYLARRPAGRGEPGAAR